MSKTTTRIVTAPLARFTVITNTRALTDEVTVVAEDDITARKVAFRHFRKTIPGYNDLNAEVVFVGQPKEG